MHLNARNVRILLNAEREYRNKRSHQADVGLPYDYICSQCGLFRGSNAKNWVKDIDQKLICKSCFLLRNSLSHEYWEQLDRQKRIDLVFHTIYQHEYVFRKLCRFDEDIFNEAVLDRIENIIVNYSPLRGILYSYIKNCVGWYAYKAWQSRQLQKIREIPSGLNPCREVLAKSYDGFEDDDFSSRKFEQYGNNRGSIEANVVVGRYKESKLDDVPLFELLESLSEFDRWLIENHIIKGFSQEKLARMAGRSKAIVNRWISAICERLKKEYQDDES